MLEQKLIKIVYHYEDGSSRSIDGEQLDDWIGVSVTLNVDREFERNVINDIQGRNKEGKIDY